MDKFKIGRSGIRPCGEMEPSLFGFVVDFTSTEMISFTIKQNKRDIRRI